MKHSKISLFVLLLLCIVFSAFNLLNDKENRLKGIALEYKGYRQHVDYQTVITDSAKYKWTIGMCSVPKDMDKERGFHFKTDSSFISKADPAHSPHGNKLYKLYVKDYLSYSGNTPKGQPIGQVIVKETWNVKEVAYDSLNKGMVQVQSRNDGKWYTPTTVSELFIMYKETENADNDKGWNYGTVSIEDKNAKPMILNDRKLSTCIGCHTQTKYDRIFGI
jgi:hypothetical protein